MKLVAEFKRLLAAGERGRYAAIGTAISVDASNRPVFDE
jgi:hypothetical protein